VQNIILASSSPRRKELMDMLGLPYVVESSSAEETLPEGIVPAEAVEMLALRKAADVSEMNGEALVIGADTIVAVDNMILGKPVDEKDALRMLLLLQGRRHQVYTGVALIDGSTGRRHVSHEITEVEFRTVSKEEALGYVGTGESEGKAGAYAIQGLASVFIRRIEGDFFNVVGLPVYRLCRMLEEYGIRVF